MIEKLEACPVCDKVLGQGEYDFQTCGTHFVNGKVRNHRKNFPALPAENPPRLNYEHDCKDCVFVRSEWSRPGERTEVGPVDLWLHLAPNSATVTVIRRFSSEPADYAARTFVR